MVSYLDKRLILWSTDLLEGSEGEEEEESYDQEDSYSLDVEAIKKVYLKQAIKLLETPDIITCIESHPQEPNRFAMGSLDKYIRIYDVRRDNEMEDDRTVDWYQSEDYITALSYSPDGRILVVGFYHGLCRVYKATEYLLYQCDVICRNSNIKELNSNRVINIKFVNRDEFIVSSSDSRIRLFHCANLDLLKLKYKGHNNTKNLLRADCDE